MNVYDEATPHVAITKGFLSKLYFSTHFTHKLKIEKLYLLGTQSILNLGSKFEVV